jgi:hypothetical protein
MLRTSRCFAENFLQLGGPGALSSAPRNPYKFRTSNFSFSKKLFYSRANRSARALMCTAIRKSGPESFATAQRTASSVNVKRTKVFTTAQSLGGIWR